MTALEIIRCMKRSTDSSIREIFEYSSKDIKYGAVQMAINQNRSEDLTVGNFVNFAEAMEYKVIVAPKGLIDTEWRVSKDAD